MLNVRGWRNQRSDSWKHARFRPALECLEARWLPSARQMEALGRGVVAIHRGGGSVYVGWRLLGTDSADVAFNLYRSTGGAAPVLLNSEPLTQTTDFVDSGVSLGQSNAYFVRPVLKGLEGAASEAFTVTANPPAQQYLSVPLQVPPPGSGYTYSPNDASVGDLDGDGEYEIVLKWDPSNSRDNSQDGRTGNVYLDAYEMDGTRLWRIDLGRNIRAGAHYTQFMVYDLDGDGRAEVACKTADATVDGTGRVIGNPDADYRNAAGRILTGPEFLTVFDGLTGAALATTNYLPPRGSVSSWGDSYGNRVDRFLAAVAYLDGERPSLVMARGYYTRSVLVAWDWRDGQLTRRWTFDTNSGYPTYAGQGNHNLSVADVDGDGKDEIIYGAAVIDDNGAGLYTTRLGHGDALHVGDLDPDRPGLEVFDIHEPVHHAGAEFRDARTGQAIWVKPTSGSEGPGRGVSADIWAGNRGAESWVAGGGISGLFDRYGNNLGRVPSSCNFLVWWDADPVRELLDGNHIDKYRPTGSDLRLLTATGSSSNNGTKSTPSLSADLFGDWREEVIWRASDNRSLRIYTTTTPATSRLFTLMHDPQYRVAVAWQNVGYNQPPHPSFYLGDGMAPPPLPNIYLAGSISPWTARDIGSVGVRGATSLVNGTFTIRGSGADIWGTADAFRYVYQPLTGDGWIFAQVSSVQSTHAWAKAGVMIRESLEADSPHASLFVSPSSGVAFQRRVNAGGPSESTSLPGFAAPYAVMVERVGDTFSAWGSADYVTWDLIDTATIPMAATVYLGLAVTSHNNAVLNTSTFDYVLTSADVGPAPGGGSGPGTGPSGGTFARAEVAVMPVRVIREVDAVATLIFSGVVSLATFWNADRGFPPGALWPSLAYDSATLFAPSARASSEESLSLRELRGRLVEEVDWLFADLAGSEFRRYAL